MSIQYAGGTLVNTTFTGATRGDIASNIKDQLVAAGWTLVRTNTTNDFVLQTATTPQSLNARLRVRDPGSGNCAQLTLLSTDEVRTATVPVYLLPAAAKTFRIIANKYQFFCFTPGSSAPREFVCYSVPYIPSFIIGQTNLAFMSGYGSSDTDTTTNRTNLRYALTNTSYGNGTSCQAHLTNSNFWETAGSSINSWDIGPSRFIIPMQAAFGGNASSSGYRWADDSLLVTEPLLAWSPTSATTEAKIQGQLWDAILLTDAYVGDSNITLDGHTWHAITNNNTGSNTTYIKGTLFVAVS